MMSVCCFRSSCGVRATSILLAHQNDTDGDDSDDLARIMVSVIQCADAAVYEVMQHELRVVSVIWTSAQKSMSQQMR